jgi:CheY-like chemotaxis protein
LSHELRTPLNAMLGWCYLLARKYDDRSVVQEGITIIQRNAKAQAQLIEDLLDMSAILSGKLRLSTENADLRQIVEGAVSTVSPAIQAKALTIDYTAPGEPIWVQADPMRLQQVVWNLLTNAIKFSAASNRIEVGVSKAGGKACITVRDFGSGIAAELLPLIFERFRQADSSSARQHGGLGLGLAIVKQVVELHHGSVQALSDGPGLGATFVVELPAVHDPHLVERRAQDRSKRAAAVDYRSLTGLSILALDDEADSLSVLRRVLEERGAEVTTVNRAEDAIKLVRDQSFDLIISDLGMPEVDGYDYLRRVSEQARENHKSLPPAIALTAYAGTEDMNKSREAGYQTHIAKPFNPEELVHSILQAVGRVS